MKRELSIIVPVFNEAEILSGSVAKILEVVQKITPSFELLLVDDGSRDATWPIISGLHQERPEIRGIRFSRNFGKEKAICAGLDHALGSAVIVLDGDLQHPPELMVEMFQIWKQNRAEVVRAVKNHRGKESWFHKLNSQIFYATMKFLSGLDLKGASDFVLLDRKIVDALRLMPEQYPFFRGLVAWAGYRQEVVTFNVAPRPGGETKWSQTKLIKYAISNLLSFSSLPLKIVNYFAALFFVFGVILGVYSIYRYLDNNAVEGFTTVIILLLLLGGGLMTGLGIIGEYIAKIHDEVKRRPRYLKADETPAHVHKA